MLQHNRIRVGCLAIAALLAGVLLCWAGVVVCARCGYEIPAESAVCEHCGAARPATQAATPDDGQPTDERPAAEEAWYLDVAVVQQEVAQGVEHLRQGDREVARLLFKNAMALDMLTDPESAPERNRRIIELVKRSEGGRRKALRVCPDCGGTGKRMMNATTLRGDVIQREAHGSGCRKCGGRGRVQGIGTVDETKYEIGRAMNRYVALQQGRQYVPIGGAWLPREAESKLSLRQEVLLKRSSALPCTDCMGLGRSECGDCKGAGWLACSYNGCENGKVETKVGGNLTNTEITRKERCPECKGTSRLVCEECRGKGGLLCRKCNGSGERPICSRCMGQGLSPCRRCHGTGLYKGTECDGCGSDGRVLCSSCNGDGRRR